MKTLSIDIETYSSVDLSKCGVYKYAEAPDFQVLLFGYAVDGGEAQVVDLAAGEEIPPEALAALTDDSVIKWAFNTAFERVCLSRYLAKQFLDPAGWRCTMIWSAYLGLPLSLAGAGAALGLDKQKMAEGKELIKYFCQPCIPTKSNGMRSRNLPSHASDKWTIFKAYNLRDVETELAIQQRLKNYPVPEDVWAQYHQDQEINDRGIALDMTLVENAIRMDEQSRHELTATLQCLTALNNPNSVAQMKQYLADNGLETETLGKKQVAALMKDCPPDLRDVLLLRQQLAKSSVKKYLAMKSSVCADGRARGMFQFYGANRTGRFSGRLIQLQNLPQNHLPDLDSARQLVRSGDMESVKLLYEDVPDTLSQLIRTAFVAKEGCKFIVADFSAIEARVIAWLAGEQWRLDVFERGGDIYCASAAQMFGVPVEKHGINAHLRQKGKIAELACIAEGSLVLTHIGLVPIEQITKDHLLWDGIEWVSHDGLVFRGEKEVITYARLTATPDHLVYIEGQSQPVQLGVAAARSAHLLQTGDGRYPIRLGGDYQPRKTLECVLESLLHAYTLLRMRCSTVAGTCLSSIQKIKGLSGMFATSADSALAGSSFDCSEATLREPEYEQLFRVRRARHRIPLHFDYGSWFVDSGKCSGCETRVRTGSHRQRWTLRIGQSALCPQTCQPSEPQEKCASAFRSGSVAVCEERRYSDAIFGHEPRTDHPIRRKSGYRAPQEMATHRGTARVYDILNAGTRHRFTVSGKLVHNCGYGGGVGALKAMGALENGLKEEELQGLIRDWRGSNPNIVKLWWDVDTAIMEAVIDKGITTAHGIRFECTSGMLFITLPSGRQLAYVKPRIGTNQFGGDAVTYMGIGSTKKWERLESYGPKFVENIVQAISRDILCYAMQTLSCCQIVAHIHDEIIIEADSRMSLEAVCEQMGRTPPWAQGLQLLADGYETQYYRKD